MSFLLSMRRLFSRKANPNPIREAISFHQVGRAVGTPRNYASFADEGFVKNVIGHACIGMVSKGAASVPLCLYRKPKSKKSRKEEITEHPYFDLMRRPNPFEREKQFRAARQAFKMIAGNAYVYGIGPSRYSPTGFMELQLLRPDRVTIIPGASGYPVAYEYKVNGRTERIPCDVVSGKSPVLHSKSFHPLDDWYGLAIIEAAARSIDQHNEAGVWNLSLLTKGCMPSGFLVAESNSANPTGSLSAEQVARIKERLREYMGSSKVGQAGVLEGGLKWVPTSISPQDMSWLEGKDSVAREVALVMGVPTMLLGIPGDNTYSNQKEARQAFFETTVLAEVEDYAEEMQQWLLPALDERSDDLVLEPDLDAVPALAPKREAIWVQNTQADYLTLDEKRERLGYEPLPNGQGSKIMVSSSMVPLEFALEDPAPSEQEPGELDPEADPEDQADDDDEADDISEDPAVEPKFKALQSPQGKTFNLKSKRAKAQEWRESNRVRIKWEKRIARLFKNHFATEGIAVVAAVAKASNAAAASDAAERIVTEFKPKWRTLIRSTLLPVGQEFGARVLKGLKGVPGAPEVKEDSAEFRRLFEEWVARYAGKQVEEISESTRKAIRKRIEKFLALGEPITVLAEEIEDLYDGFSSSRATTIARTEVHTAANEASLQAAKSTGIPNLRKEWIFTEDDRTRPTHRLPKRRAVVGINEKFDVAGEKMDAPGDPAGGPGNVINCRCTVAFLSEND